MAGKSGLGRGLNELIRNTSAPQPEPERPQEPTQAASDGALADGVRLADIDVERIVPNPKQPRTNFDEDDLAELVESIKEIGVLQPVVVRPKGDGYELVMGERRLRASKEAGKATIPAVVRDTADDDLLRDALLENLHRSQLNPLEEAAAYQQMLGDFGCTQDELASRIKRSRSHIANTIRLLNLPGPVQRRVAAGVLSAGHARALLALDSPLKMEQLAQRIVAEGLSVRATEEIVALGERELRAPQSRGPRRVHPRAEELSQDLSDRFDTRVKVDIRKNRGHITIEFAGEGDLDRILAVLDGQAL